jgi:cytoskeletal protein CcmA (bactofilin family)
MKGNSFAADDNITLLAKGVVLKGEIHVEGTVRIDGRLDGDIQTKGQVIIGEDGLVQGTITDGDAYRRSSYAGAHHRRRR